MKTKLPLLLLCTCALSVAALPARAADPFVKDKPPAPTLDPAQPEPAPNLEIDAAFIAFPLKEVEALARKGGASSDALQKAWAEGQGRLLRTTKVVTRSGQTANAQGVEEIIYPTGFEAGTVADATSSPTENSPTNEPPAAAKAARPPPPSQRHTELPIPGEFETRGVGGILNVTPDLGPDGHLVNLTLVPEYSEYLPSATEVRRADPTGATALQLPNPKFYSCKLQTQVLIRDGQTLVLGGGPSRDGNEIVYCFITLRLLPVPRH